MVSQAAYADLEIRILERQAQGYPVEITLNHEQEYARGYLDPKSLPLPWVATASAEADGERLFRWLLADERLKTAWAEVRGCCPQRRVRLRIDASAPELHALPWELLHDPGEGSIPQNLAATVATPFSRYLAGRWQPGSPILKRPIKVLVAIANPQNLEADYQLSSINVEYELAILKEAVNGLDVEITLFPPSPIGFSLPKRDGGVVTVTSQTQPCTLADLEFELKQGYHVLHFIGHGSYSKEEQKAVLFFADSDNRVKKEHDTDIAEMLARQLADTETYQHDKLRLVFLASCQTATRSPANAFRGLAPKLVEAGVPAVLAMQDLVPLETARQFANTFYKQLLKHGLVDLASNEARSALTTARLPGAAIPVLFMRLRSGELLGQRGHITSDRREEDFWPFLLENIDQGHCTPFLGPRTNAGLLPAADTVAKTLAEKYRYPLPACMDLAKVAQFMALKEPDVLRRDFLRILKRGLFSHLGLKPTDEEKRRYEHASLTETAQGINWVEKIMDLQENEMHPVLASLPLPLYVTTNVDSFMFEALKYKKYKRIHARREGPRWGRPQAGSPQYILSPAPSFDDPVVFHLNGCDSDSEQQKHIVLSEDDYLTHLVRLSRDQETSLPANLLGMLSPNSFLFLGYSLDDWEFRILLQGLIKPIAQTNQAKKLHVGVQLEPEQAPSAEKAMDYLRRYLGQFSIDVYWGTSQQFVADLYNRWQDYVRTTGDGW